jgi:hypothetical protein
MVRRPAGGLRAPHGGARSGVFFPGGFSAWLPFERDPQGRGLLAGGPLSVALERGGLGGHLLVWTVPLSFGSGLIGLGVSPFGVAVPRWLILAYGVACALKAVLAVLLSRPWQQLQPSAGQHDGHRKAPDADGSWAATWDGALARARPPAGILPSGSL